MPSPRTQAGFSMVEMLTVIAVMGVLFALSVPAYQAWANSHALHSSATMIAGELQNLRARAMATGEEQTIHFNIDYPGYGDIHMHTGSYIGAHWDLPNGIRYAHTGALEMKVTRDGRFANSNYLILVDRKNNRDTVSVQISGLVLVR